MDMLFSNLSYILKIHIVVKQRDTKFQYTLQFSINLFSKLRRLNVIRKQLI